MTRIHAFIALAGATLVQWAGAQAQADVNYSGKWAATILAESGKRQAARLDLTEFSGTWRGRMATREAGKKTCGASSFPVTVQRSDDEHLDFTVWGSAVGPNCADLTVELHPAGPNAFEGRAAPLGTVRLTRR